MSVQELRSISTLFRSLIEMKHELKPLLAAASSSVCHDVGPSVRPSVRPLLKNATQFTFRVHF